MLKERGVAPFSKWEKELPKIVFDPRFKVLRQNIFLYLVWELVAFHLLKFLEQLVMHEYVQLRWGNFIQLCFSLSCCMGPD